MDRVRQSVVKGLARLDPSRAKTKLVQLLRDDTVWEIRAEAARTLAKSGDPDVLPALEAALEDSNEFVRSAAANAIRVHEEVAGRRPDPAQEIE